MAIAGREATPAPQFLSHYKNDSLLRVEDRGGMAAPRLSAAEVKQNVARLSAIELWSELKREKLLDPNAPTPN
jgi:hypothetical protein